MGNLTPAGAGVRCSWVAVFKSILMMTISYLVLKSWVVLGDQVSVIRSLKLFFASTLTLSPASDISEILMFFKTSSMLWFTLRNGSRIVQRSVWSHSPRTVMHDVMK